MNPESAGAAYFVISEIQNRKNKADPYEIRIHVIKINWSIFSRKKSFDLIIMNPWFMKVRIYVSLLSTEFSWLLFSHIIKIYDLNFSRFWIFKSISSQWLMLETERPDQSSSKNFARFRFTKLCSSKFYIKKNNFEK